jgi:hypothetical protein
VEGHKAIHDMLVKQKQQMTYTSTVAKIAFLKPDVALVHATWEWPGFPLPAGKEAKDFKGIITMVMVKQADTWLIRAVQNTLTSAPAQAAMQASSRNTNPEARSIGVSINRPPNEVYDFASNPENLPQWATGLGGSIQQVDGEWVAEAPMGKVTIRFVENNPFGILDHDVILESGGKMHNPMRVVPNGLGSEVIFTLFRQPGVSDEQFAEDTQWVEKDLRMLRDLLEQ